MSHIGNKPMKKPHPGVHPGGEGSKKPRAKAAERRPTAASAENPMRVTVKLEMALSNFNGTYEAY